MNYLDLLPPEEQAKELKNIYREVFGTPKGQIVLTELLTELYYFDIPENTDHQVLRNFATMLASRVFSSDKENLVKAMFNVPQEE